METIPESAPKGERAWPTPARAFAALHALATLAIAVYGIHAAASTNQMTLHHYRIERVMILAERFNGGLVTNRQVVDQFLASGLAPAALLDRAEARLAGRHDPGDGDRYLEMARDVKLFVAFFQEVGVALRHEILDERYTWDVFGALAKRYGQELRPFVAEARRRAGRDTLYRDFDLLVERMHQLDGVYGHPGSTEAVRLVASRPRAGAAALQPAGGALVTAATRGGPGSAGGVWSAWAVQ